MFFAMLQCFSSHLLLVSSRLLSQFACVSAWEVVHPSLDYVRVKAEVIKREVTPPGNGQCIYTGKGKCKLLVLPVNHMPNLKHCSQL